MRNKINRFLSTFLIFCLLVSLVCLAFIYMFSFQTSNELKFNAEDMAALEQNFAAAGYMDSVNTRNILPVFVGVSLADAQMRTGSLDGEILEKLYEDCFEVAGKYLTRGNAEDISEERAEDFVRMAKNNGFFYIKYSAAYPKSVIVSFTDKDYFAQNVSDEYIREIFVFYNNYTSSVCVLALSGGEKNYLYSGYFGYDEKFNNNIVNEYNNSEGTFYFTFASEETQNVFISKEKFGEAIYANTVIPKNEVVLPKISFENVSERLLGNGVYNKILSVFTLNPEKISVFTDSDGTVTYFEEGQNVGIRLDGTVEYSAAEIGGIDIGSVIGYHAENDEYSLRDKIGATLLIAEKIVDISDLDEDISVKLSGISYDDGGNLIITYSLSYRGVDIACETNVFSFTVSGNRIRKTSCHLFDVCVYGENSALPNAFWQISAYASAAVEISDICPAYAYSAGAHSVAAQYHSCFKGEEAEQ